ncbi:hypothetical protein MKW94_004982 [Papaver nudicaule]|uniref:Transposase, Ptta/En/Spm, plant n=1 Tax=Papaver nudicaule TaxID=74823 RepID=A0AA41VP40_PAPNU|nr:hypothetical protein [Papaver nudicaule]MCL7044885.1 hypothetical protein [Papaver nudicaule]
MEGASNERSERLGASNARLERLGDSNDGDEMVKQNVRGRSRGIDLDDWMARNDNKKLPIKFSPVAGEPISINRCKLSTECGIIVRDFAPMQYASWTKIPAQDRAALIERVKDKFDLDTTRPSVKRFLNDTMAKRYSDYRCKMSKHFKKCKTIEEAQAKPFDVITQDNWLWLCNHFASSKFKKRSAAGSNNRKQVKYNHCGGSRAFQVRLEKKKLLGVQAAKIQTFKETHMHRVQGELVWISETAHTQYDKMIEMHEQGIVAGGTPDENEIYDEVLERKTKRRRKHNFTDEELDELIALLAAKDERIKQCENQVEQIREYSNQVKQNMLNEMARIPHIAATYNIQETS